MKAPGVQQQRKGQPDVIEFVPKPELERAQQQIEKQKLEIERLLQENDRLRKELEAALRAGKRQAAPHSPGPTEGQSETAWSQTRLHAGDTVEIVRARQGG